MNLQDLLSSIMYEYPFLANSELKMEKHFSTYSEKLSNTYLFSSNKVGFEQFIIKGHGLKSESLLNEWSALKHLHNIQFPYSKLLLPQHIPTNFLLTEYIQGNTVEKILGNKQEIFYEIGKTTSLLHSISLQFVGPFSNPQQISWKEYLQEKIRNLEQILKPMISEDIYIEMVKKMHEFQPLLEHDNHETVFIHHDIYLNNFLFKENLKQAYLIDFAIALGGRPLYDLAKFYIIELYKYPEYTDIFLKGYTQKQQLPSGFKMLMKLYILREAMAIVKYADKIDDTQFKNHGIEIIKQVIEDKGRVIDLLG